VLLALDELAECDAPGGVQVGVLLVLDDPTALGQLLIDLDPGPILCGQVGPTAAVHGQLC
jgi:hypothetical protein